MKKSKIEISAKVLDTIADSQVLTECEKVSFLKYVGYMTYEEQKELCVII